MATRNPRQQDHLFYDECWNANYEQEFIFRLAYYARLANITIKRSNIIAIRSSIDSVNFKYRTNFTYKKAHMYFKRLQQQHTVFGFIIMLPPVTYDAENNVVIAEPFIWDYVCLVILCSYMRCGERHWNKLCRIFENPIPVDVFSDLDIIQISDDSSNPTHAGSATENARPQRCPRPVTNSFDLSASFSMRFDERDFLGGNGVDNAISPADSYGSTSGTPSKPVKD
ncbi:hypothetical protein CDL12_03872 [Handroanthus impetiginosus]|uniref:Uncharacterized protein n=1 Tax=Handroanthus impetiginosus TaxID=429701 RepID=A0A2G9I0X2_9LAMI|nr:hypothetical protein CDL12_03872 [Handroanthus impetiginosus]